MNYRMLVDDRNRKHPGPGWVQLPPGTILQSRDVFYCVNRWAETYCSGSAVEPPPAGRAYFRYGSVAPRIPHEDD